MLAVREMMGLDPRAPGVGFAAAAAISAAASSSAASRESDSESTASSPSVHARGPVASTGADATDVFVPAAAGRTTEASSQTEGVEGAVPASTDVAAVPADKDSAKVKEKEKDVPLVPPEEEPIDVTDRSALEGAIQERKAEYKRRFEMLEHDTDRMRATAKIAVALTVLAVLAAVITIPLSFGVTGALAAAILLVPAAFGGGALAEGGAWANQWLAVREERSKLREKQGQLADLEQALEKLHQAEEEAHKGDWTAAATRLVTALGLPNPWAVAPPKPAARSHVSGEGAASGSSASAPPAEVSQRPLPA